MDLQNLIDEFVGKLREQIADTLTEAMTGVLNGNDTNNSNGAARAHAPAQTPAGRKKPPKQLCPVPRCKGLAAPIFGMVCAKHKDISKVKIRKYREARKAAKAKAAGK